MHDSWFLHPYQHKRSLDKEDTLDLMNKSFPTFSILYLCYFFVFYACPYFCTRVYGRYELILRYGFLAMTVFVAAVYIDQMTKLSGQMWGYQQKWIVLLLLFLVLFDGPLAYPRIYTVRERWYDR